MLLGGRERKREKEGGRERVNTDDLAESYMCIHCSSLSTWL